MLYVIAGGGMSRRAVRVLSNAVAGTATVVEDRRVRDRRAERDRRSGSERHVGYERRRVVGVHGRRVADRRALALPALAPRLPLRVRRHASRIAFVTRLSVPTEYLDAVATARLALAAQAGDRQALMALYDAHLDTVHAFARACLRGPALAEAATQRTFAAMLAGIEEFDPRIEPFRHWLFRLALEETAEAPGPEPQGPVRRPRPAGGGEALLRSLRWVADRELRLLVERLPPQQRRVVLLRHLAGLPRAVVAELLGLEPAREEELHATALTSVARTLAGLGAAMETMQQREHMRRLPRVGRVLHERRAALKR